MGDLVLKLSGIYLQKAWEDQIHHSRFRDAANDLGISDLALIGSDGQYLYHAKESSRPLHVALTALNIHLCNSSFLFWQVLKINPHSVDQAALHTVYANCY